jgi:transcriptional regulator with XRE-family HTH domain
MTALAMRTLYEDAVRGEPLQCVFTRPAIDTHAPLWLVGDWPLRIPSLPPRPMPASSRLVALLRGRTGWSARQLAAALGTSHTTIRRIENGRPLMAAHSGDLGQRLQDVSDVVERIYWLTGDAEITARTLEDTPPGLRSPLEELQAGQPAKAYLAAIDVLRPRRPGLLSGDRPRRDGATAPLHE